MQSTVNSSLVLTLSNLLNSYIQYTKESVKEMKEYMLSFKSRLLKVKTRDEFTSFGNSFIKFIIILPQKYL
jgi:hypothetical protein